jgi:hypothetical protein
MIGLSSIDWGFLQSVSRSWLHLDLRFPGVVRFDARFNWHQRNKD